MKKTAQTVSHGKIVVRVRHSLSSSFSREMAAAGRAASAAAIKQAKAAGVSISYLKDGVVVREPATAMVSK